MRQFENLDHPALLDLLARQTSLYTRLLTENDRSLEFYKCKRLIDQLTTAIEKRKKTGRTGHSGDTKNFKGRL
jgi:hypothetical protein